jgi:hypothetical protein
VTRLINSLRHPFHEQSQLLLFLIAILRSPPRPIFTTPNSATVHSHHRATTDNVSRSLNFSLHLYPKKQETQEMKTFLFLFFHQYSISLKFTSSTMTAGTASSDKGDVDGFFLLVEERDGRGLGDKRLTFLRAGNFRRGETSLLEEPSDTTGGFSSTTGLEQSNAKKTNLKMLYLKSTTKRFQSA